MVKTLIVRPEAEDDVRETFEWYESKQIGLGNNFLEETDLLFQRIEEYPNLFPKVYRELQRALLHRFPYAVYFLQDDNIATVFGVLHQRRNPAEWQRRLNT
ncbi:MAG: type II toxin-antitoxin system RelE/ParE family toxin [Nitrospinae bacterium]|nr:type II toxin-antitoxin system RelE/ParE family toxin [Nitrospinota bacterium]